MHIFKDPARITLAAVTCVAIYMVTSLLLAFALANDYAGQANYLSAMESGPSVFLALANLAILIACFVVVGIWIYRASANAHSFSDEMTISPGWAVGWYFVPIMNLIRPYQAMREIWLASHFRGNWHGEPAPAILGWWWGLWIVTNILGNIAWRLGDNLEAADAVFVLDMAGSALNLPLCLTLIVIMRTIARAQTTAVHDEVFA